MRIPSPRRDSVLVPRFTHSWRAWIAFLVGVSLATGACSQLYRNTVSEVFAPKKPRSVLEWALFPFLATGTIAAWGVVDIPAAIYEMDHRGRLSSKHREYGAYDGGSSYSDSYPTYSGSGNSQPSDAGKKSSSTNDPCQSWRDSPGQRVRPAC